MTSVQATSADVLAPYLPRLAIEWAETAPDDRCRVFDGSLVLVDLAGFTSLSERLAALGRVGAEELTSSVGSAFADLLAAAYAEGGSLLKFGGDALLLLFDGNDHPERACNAALRMRSRMTAMQKITTSVGPVKLRMSVGVHSGMLHAFRLGSSHHELIITGPGATATVEMEKAADTGEVFASMATAERLPAGRTGAARGPGVLLRALRDDVQPTSFPAAPTARVDLSDSIPTALREQLLTGAVESEHRTATVAFIGFEGIDRLLVDRGPDVVADQLDALVARAQHAADEFGVTFLGADIDRDGGKLILVAGAPAAKGDDEERMLRVLRSVIDGRGSLAVRIGVNRGHVFAGEVGPAYRRTFTVMGDAVNVAARLMAQAHLGEILATPAVLERSRAGFHVSALRPLYLKGKAAPVAAVGVGQPTGRRQVVAEDASSLVGRDDEVGELLCALDVAGDGHEGCVVVVSGPPGIGKSRLVGEVASRSEASDGVNVVRSYCEPFEAQTPYLGFRFGLRGALGIKSWGTAGGAALREVVAARAPEMLPWLPLLAAVAGVDVDRTPECDAIEPQFVPDRTADAVLKMMRAAVVSPTLVIVDDAQWCDVPSLRLLQVVGGVQEVPWRVCVVTRDEPGHELLGGDAVRSRLTVGPLADAAARTLVDRTIGEALLMPHERDAVVRRGAGNPLFLQELARSVGAEADAAAAVPESLEAIVAAEIDRLKPADRNLMRHLAVLGNVFEDDLLSGLADGASANEIVVRMGRFVERAGDGLLRFRNQCYREVAYDTLPFARRKEVHAWAGEVIERFSTTHEVDRSAVLSYHFLHAQAFRKCWHYSSAAAARAEAEYANAEAADLLDRALGAAKKLPDLDASEVEQTCIRLADVAIAAGAYDRARGAYRQAWAASNGDTLAKARLCGGEANVALFLGELTRAVRWLRRGLRDLAAEGGTEAASLRAGLAISLAETYVRTGRRRAAVDWCETAIENAREANDSRRVGIASTVLDMALMSLGRMDEATHSETALEAFEAAGAMWSKAGALLYLGAFACWRGDWDTAVDYFDQGTAAYMRVGDVVQAAHGSSNRAEVLINQGRYEDLGDQLEETLRLFRSARNGYGEAAALLNIGRRALRRGHTAEARDLFAAARDAGGGIDAIDTDVEAWTAEAWLREGDPDQAIVLLDGALRRESATGDTTHRSRLHTLRAYALAALGDNAGVAAEIDSALSLARTRGDGYDIAAALQAASALRFATGRSEDTEAAVERENLLQRLGVIAAPPPPLPDPVADLV